MTRLCQSSQASVVPTRTENLANFRKTPSLLSSQVLAILGISETNYCFPHRGLKIKSTPIHYSLLVGEQGVALAPPPKPCAFDVLLL